MADDYHINPQPEKPSLAERYVAMWKENYNNSPSFLGSAAAILRDGIKDSRQTLNEFFFGHGEHASEPGTPLNPTQIQVTAEQGNFHGYDPIYEPSTAGQYIKHEQEHERGIGH